MLMASEHHVTARRRRHDYVEFRIIKAATFPLFLLAAAIHRLMPLRSAQHAKAVERSSLIEEARVMADCALLFAYIG